MSDSPPTDPTPMVPAPAPDSQPPAHQPAAFPVDRSPERQRQLRQLICDRFADLDYLGRLPHPHSLRSADLHALDLRGLDLDGADLSWASLRDADLRDAHLNGATFYGTDLTGTQLPDSADLMGVDFRDTQIAGLIDLGAPPQRARPGWHDARH